MVRQRAAEWPFELKSLDYISGDAMNFHPRSFGFERGQKNGFDCLKIS